jgi:hypothetical protein
MGFGGACATPGTAAQHSARVTAPVRPVGYRKIHRQGADQEETAPAFGVRIAWKAADVVETCAAVHHVQHTMRVTMIDDDVYSARSLRVPNDIADKLTEDELGVRALICREVTLLQWLDELPPNRACFDPIAHVKAPALNVPLDLRTIGAHD